MRHIYIKVCWYILYTYVRSKKFYIKVFSCFLYYNAVLSTFASLYRAVKQEDIASWFMLVTNTMSMIYWPRNNYKHLTFKFYLLLTSFESKYRSDKRSLVCNSFLICYLGYEVKNLRCYCSDHVGCLISWNISSQLKHFSQYFK